MKIRLGNHQQYDLDLVLRNLTFKSLLEQKLMICHLSFVNHDTDLPLIVVGVDCYLYSVMTTFSYFCLTSFLKDQKENFFSWQSLGNCKHSFPEQRCTLILLDLQFHMSGQD